MQISIRPRPMNLKVVIFKSPNVISKSMLRAECVGWSPNQKPILQGMPTNNYDHEWHCYELSTDNVVAIQHFTSILTWSVF